MTPEQLNKIVTISHADVICKAFNDTCQRFEINTPIRQAHFLGQILHESCCFKYSEEIATGQAYEGRKDLGNVFPGDGKKYKGRGYIMTTGRYNYEKLSEELDVNFIRQPELLKQLPYSMLASGYFWQSKKLNKWADKDNCFMVSCGVNGINKKLITKEYQNGQPNHLPERIFWTNKCKEILIIL